MNDMLQRFTRRWCLGAALRPCPAGARGNLGLSRPSPHPGPGDHHRAAALGQESGALRRRPTASVSMTDVTQILSAIEQGDPSAAEQLLPLVYQELRRLAIQRLAHEAPGQT